VVAPVGAAFTLAMVVYLYLIERRLHDTGIPWGTFAVATLLLYQIGEVTYTVLALGFEASMLRTCRFSLHRLSPIDTVALRRALRSTNRLGLLVCGLATLFILGFIVLLWDKPALTGPLSLVMLIIAFVATAVGV